MYPNPDSNGILGAGSLPNFIPGGSNGFIDSHMISGVSYANVGDSQLTSPYNLSFGGGDLRKSATRNWDINGLGLILTPN